MQYPKFTLKPSMDYIVLSIQRIDFHSLKNIISKNSNFIQTNHYKLDYLYDFSMEYQMPKYNDKVLRLLISKENPFLPILMKIEEPTIEILNFIHNFGVLNNIQYKISSMELTFDFVTPDKSIESIMEMYSFLVQHVYLKWAGKLFYNDYETTTYIGNCRLTRSKAVRIYVKENEHGVKEKSRLELILKRKILKRYNVELITDLNKDVYNQIISKYIELKFFKLEIYEMKYLRKLRKLYKTLTDNEIQNMLLMELDTIKNIHNNKSIVESFRYIQGQVSGPYDCIEKSDFHDIFFSRIKNRNFC